MRTVHICFVLQNIILVTARRGVCSTRAGRHARPAGQHRVSVIIVGGVQRGVALVPELIRVCTDRVQEVEQMLQLCVRREVGARGRGREDGRGGWSAVAAGACTPAPLNNQNTEDSHLPRPGAPLPGPGRRGILLEPENLSANALKFDGPDNPPSRPCPLTSKESAVSEGAASSRCRQRPQCARRRSY